MTIPLPRSRPCRWNLPMQLTALSALLLVPAIGRAAPDFDKDIAPLLVSRCLECHSGADPKGSLDLSRKESAKNVAELLKRVTDDEMPPKKPLPAAEKALLKQWVDAGAPWGTNPIDPFATTTKTRAGRDWWSRFRPVLTPLMRSFKSNLPRTA